MITSYAVAEAITVPLTGWLAGRFGAVRVFITAVLLFGVCSRCCAACRPRWHAAGHAGAAGHGRWAR